MRILALCQTSQGFYFPSTSSKKSLFACLFVCFYFPRQSAFLVSFIGQAGLSLKALSASVSQMLELKVCIATPSPRKFIFLVNTFEEGSDFSITLQRRHDIIK